MAYGFACRVVSAALMFGVAASASAPSRAAAGSPGFFEDFDRLDTERWYVSDGWTNGAHQGCIWRKGQISAADGILTLKLTKTGKPATTGSGEERNYVCAELQTRKTFGFGLYETRMTAAAGSGLVSAMFTYTGPAQKTKHDEIDVEVLGRDMSRFDTNYFANGKGENQKKVTLPAPADETMTDYAFEWTPDRLRWYVNGELVREAEGHDMTAGDQKVFLSLWNGAKGTTGWLGAPDDSIEEATMAVDYIAFTPAGERCLFERSITCADDWSADRQ